MHEDNELKAMLRSAAIQKASPTFTDDVMHRIDHFLAQKKQYNPLVAAKWIQWYLRCLFIICGLALMVSLSIELSTLTLAIQIQMPLISTKYLLPTFSYLAAFWLMVFFTQEINRMQKNVTNIP